MKYKLQIMKSVNVDVPQILTSQNDLFCISVSRPAPRLHLTPRHLVHAQAKEKKKSGT